MKEFGIPVGSTDIRVRVNTTNKLMAVGTLHFTATQGETYIINHKLENNEVVFYLRDTKSELIAYV